jgi:hypothetical protein
MGFSPLALYSFHITFILTFACCIVGFVNIANDSFTKKSDCITTWSSILAFAFYIAWIVIGLNNYRTIQNVEWVSTKNGTVFIYEGKSVFSERVDISRNPSKVQVTENLFGFRFLNLP